MDIQIDDAWNKIINELLPGARFFPTTPMSRKESVWFSASTDGVYVFIDNAVGHLHSCNIKSTRTLTKNEFTRIIPIYYRRKNGERISQEATIATRNQVYFYSLIKNVVDI